MRAYLKTLLFALLIPVATGSLDTAQAQKKTATHLKAEKISEAQANSPLTMTATLKFRASNKSWQPAQAKEIQFSFGSDSKSVATAITDANGRATATTHLPQGVKRYTARFVGDSTLRKSRGNARILNITAPSNHNRNTPPVTETEPEITGIQGWRVAPGTTFRWSASDGTEFTTTELTLNGKPGSILLGVRQPGDSRFQYRRTDFQSWASLLPPAYTTANFSLSDVWDGIKKLPKKLRKVAEHIKDVMDWASEIKEAVYAVIEKAKELISVVIGIFSGNPAAGAEVALAFQQAGEEGRDNGWLLSQRIQVAMERTQQQSPQISPAIARYIKGK